MIRCCYDNCNKNNTETFVQSKLFRKMPSAGQHSTILLTCCVKPISPNKTFSSDVNNSNRNRNHLFCLYGIFCLFGGWSVWAVNTLHNINLDLCDGYVIRQQRSYPLSLWIYLVRSGFDDNRIGWGKTQKKNEMRCSIIFPMRNAQSSIWITQNKC